MRKVHHFGSGHFQTYSGVEEKMQGQIKKSTTEQNLNVLGSSEGKLFLCLTETSWMFQIMAVPLMKVAVMDCDAL